jgi:cytidyltransferase-like protein
MTTAVYAGSFDPPTEGHLWVIEQAAKLFDELVVSVGENPLKKATFAPDERMRMIQESVTHLTNVKVTRFRNKFLVNYASEIVESGIDFSFNMGFREVAGLTNIQQFAGRINRNNEHPNASVYVFELTVPKYPKGNDFTSNPDLVNSSAFFRTMYKKGEIGPEWCDKAIKNELQGGVPAIGNKMVQADNLVKWDEQLKLRELHDSCRVIPQEKVTVIPRANYLKLKSQFDEKGWVSKTDIVRKSFQFYSDKASKHAAVVPIAQTMNCYDPFVGFYTWIGLYDPDFLGYMENEI